MNWQQVNCISPKQDAEALSLLLETFGALSVTYQDAEDNPIFEPQPNETPLWNAISLTALYSATQDLTALSQAIKTNFPQTQQVVINALEEQQWERTWMEDYHPMQFGEQLWIYPSNYERPDDDNTHILLDPGLAFGTGTHPTTALCLEWLDQHPPKNLHVLDYGCGSGILAIAALKLGAKHVIATDIDEQALLASEDNSQLNAIASETITICFPQQLASKQYATVDCLLANILAGPLCELANTFADFIKPQGTIVLSGILKEQQQDIIDAYTPFFTTLHCEQRHDWLRVTGIRK